MKSHLFTLLVIIVTGTYAGASNPTETYKKIPRSTVGSYDPQNGIGPQVSWLYLSNTKTFTPGLGITLVKQMGDYSDIYSGVDLYFSPFSYERTATAKPMLSYNKDITVPVSYNIQRITKFFIGGTYYLNGDYESEQRFYVLFAFSPFIISGDVTTEPYDDRNYTLDVETGDFLTGGFTVNGGVGIKVKLGKWNWCTDVQYNHNLFADDEAEFSPQYFIRAQTGLWYPF